MKKKIFAAILAIAMMFSIAPNMPVLAAAGDSYAESIAIGAAGYEGTLNGDGEKYFKFTTSSKSSFYTLYLQNRSNGGIDYTVYTDVYGADRYTNGWASSRSTKNDDLGKLTKSYTYYVKLEGTENAAFKIAVIERPDDVADDGETAKAIQLNQLNKYTLQDGNDDDYFSFTTTKNDSFYWVSLENYSSKTISVVVYKDRYSSDAIDDFWAYSKNTKTITFGKLTPNTKYYVKVCSNDGDCITSDAYGLKVLEKKDEVKDYCSKAKEIAVGKGVKAAIQDINDSDCYKFKTLNKNVDYVITVKNSSVSGSVTILVYNNKEEVDYIYDRWVYKGESVTLPIENPKKNKYYYIKVKTGGNLGNYSVSVKPKARGIKSSSTKGIKKGFKFSAKADGTVSGYQVRYHEYGKSKWTTKTFKTSKSKIKNKSIKGLKRNKYYNVEVRTWYAYKGKKYYSDWEYANDGSVSWQSEVYTK